MSAPRAPRKSTGGVDVQLEEFATDLHQSLGLQLDNINHGFWAEADELSIEDNQMIDRVIAEAFLDLEYRYQNVQPIMDLLEHCRILIQNVVWASMNVPRPWRGEDHIEAVVNNALQVYNRVIYAPLRTEMIMSNHNASVLQRTWRRCVTDPEHPACRRRIEFEFNEFSVSLGPKSF